MRAQDQTSSLTRSRLSTFAVGANVKQFFLTASVWTLVPLCSDLIQRDHKVGYPTPVNGARAASAGVEGAPYCP